MSATLTLPGSGIGHRRHALNRWIRLLAAVLAMMAIATMLYAWPLLRAGEAPRATENALAAFVIGEMVLVPVESWLSAGAARRALFFLGCALVPLGAIGASWLGPGRGQVACYAAGGVGAGLVYAGTVAIAVKGFTDRKVLCIGVSAAACVAFVLLLAGTAAALGAPEAARLLGLLGAVQATVVVMAMLFILEPPPPEPFYKA